ELLAGLAFVRQPKQAAQIAQRQTRATKRLHLFSIDDANRLTVEAHGFADGVERQSVEAPRDVHEERTDDRQRDRQRHGDLGADRRFALEVDDAAQTPDVRLDDVHPDATSTEVVDLIAGRQTR